MSDAPRDVETLPLNYPAVGNAIIYPHTGRPLLRIRWDGAWRTALVIARDTMPDGRTALNVEVRLPTEFAPRGELFFRCVVWNPDRIRVVWDGRDPNG